MSIRVQAKSQDDVQELTEAYLSEKGVEKGSAKYLAELFAKSDRGRQMAQRGEIVPMGNCSLLGLSPG